MVTKVGFGYETEGVETLETVRLQITKKVKEERTNLPKTLCFIDIVVCRFYSFLFQRWRESSLQPHEGGLQWA